MCRGKTVLDLGSGCGASAIAAKLSGAGHVVANDIDTGMCLLLFLLIVTSFSFPCLVRNFLSLKHFNGGSCPVNEKQTCTFFVVSNMVRIM